MQSVTFAAEVFVIRQKEPKHSSEKGMPFLGLNSIRDFSCQALTGESNE